MEVLQGIWQIGPVKGAIVGGAMAFGWDLVRWSASDDPFNFKKSLKRVVGGAVMGTGFFGAVTAAS